MSNRLLMADVSSVQGRIDVAAMHNAGYGAIAVKATQGDNYVNPFYADTVDQAHRLRMIVVHYHFGVASSGGIVQAKHFLSVVRPRLRSRRDWLAVDVEGQPPSYPQWTKDGAKLFANSFRHVMWNEAPTVGLLRRRPRRLTYGPPYFLRDNGVKPYERDKLWLADYDGDPTVLAGMGWRSWTIWQFTDHAHVPGVATPVDESHIRPGVLRRMAAYPTLRFGDKGQGVRLLQHLLRQHGWRDVDVIGQFDKHTLSAVNELRHRHGWRQNGVAGPRVWRVLTR